jgi:hypothetical protein
MKKIALLLIVMMAILMAACVAITSVSAQHDFDAFSGTQIDDASIDGAIGSE